MWTYFSRWASYSSRWTKVNKEVISELTLTSTDLSEGDEYKFRVAAVNEAGVGPSCEPISLIAKDPYGNNLYYTIILLMNIEIWVECAY